MKDNLEDFFKHTLEDFNDAPTDKVWEELEQRLEPINTTVFNNKLIIPFLMMCLIAISTFSLIGNISLHQETEKLAVQIEEKQCEMIALQKENSVVSQKYLSMQAYCKPPTQSRYSQDHHYRGEDIIPMMEL